MSEKIEFVSYDGKYPNLCRGKLVVKIDGKELSFGATQIFKFEKDKTPADYPRFWCSGGSIHYKKNYSGYNIEHGDWEMLGSEKEYPPEIWKILPDILRVMNENVDGGCCGGCV